MSKLGNTLAMLKLLENGKKYTVNELAQIIEVSPRMIKEYKRALEQAGIYIDSINGIYGGYVYNKKNNYDVSFNIKDVNSLEKVSLKLTSSDKSIIEPLLEKIRTIVIYSNQYNDNSSSEEDYKRKYRIISKAIKEREDIIFKYNKKTKILTPHNISFYKDLIYITGYSKSDKDLRTYNINEINFE